MVPGSLAGWFIYLTVTLPFFDPGDDYISTFSRVRAEVAVIVAACCAAYCAWMLTRIYRGRFEHWWLAPIAYLATLVSAVIGWGVVLATFSGG